MEQNKTYKILEFDKILQRLSAYTESDYVKNKKYVDWLLFKTHGGDKNEKYNEIKYKNFIRF